MLWLTNPDESRKGVRLLKTRQCSLFWFSSWQMLDRLSPHSLIRKSATILLPAQSRAYILGPRSMDDACMLELITSHSLSEAMVFSKLFESTLRTHIWYTSCACGCTNLQLFPETTSPMFGRTVLPTMFQAFIRLID